MDKTLPVQKAVWCTNSCLHERKKLYHGRVAALFCSFLLACHVFYSHFLQLPNFFFPPAFHMGRYSASGYRPVWLLSKCSFCSQFKTRFAPVTVNVCVCVCVCVCVHIYLHKKNTCVYICVYIYIYIYIYAPTHKNTVYVYVCIYIYGWLLISNWITIQNAI